MEKIINFRPGWNDDGRGIGIHCMEICFVLKGEYGAVQFLMSTGWYPPETQRNLLSRDGERNSVVSMWTTMFQPRAYDLGYHSKKPMYEGQRPMGAVRFDFEDSEEIGEVGNKLALPKEKETGTFTHCEYTDGHPCYYDGSSLNAQPIFNEFLVKGESVVWERLEDYYKNVFGELK